MKDFKSLCLKVCELSQTVGEYIAREATEFNKNVVEYKELNNLVSYVDKVAEKQIVNALSLFLPEAGFIAEEGTLNFIAPRYNWIIDPLDGTTNFVHGVPTYSVSIALQEYDELVLGVVYEIGRKECFYTWKDAPSFLNGREIRVSSTPHLKDSLIATGFPYYIFDKQDNYLELLKKLMQKTRGIRRMGSAAVDLAYTACGRFDVYFEYNLNVWDVAAGILLVKNAGGHVYDFSGLDHFLEKKEIIASNTLLDGIFLEILSECFYSRAQ